MALLAARWLSRDARTRLVDSTVGVGVLVMSLLVATYFLREERADSWKSAKSVVLAHRASTAGQALNQPLYFVGDLPYSASFYSQGKAKMVPGNAELLKLMDQGSVLVALNPDQIQALPDAMNARLKLQVSSGAYKLYLSVLK